MTQPPVSLAEARREQHDLARQVVIADRLGQVSLVAGVDVHYGRDGAVAFAAAVLLTFPELEPAGQATARQPAPWPYRSGYLSFREAPPALAALAGLPQAPHLVLCDGQGLAHPRGLGLACHLGVAAGLPTVGAAKSRLTGRADEPGPARGDRTALLLGGRQVGWVLRTRAGVKPLYVSPGHLVGVDSAARLTLACCTRYRQPEPLRAAHKLAKAARAAGGPIVPAGPPGGTPPAGP